MTHAGSCFVVRTADPLFREVLPGLAYSAVDDEFVRWFPADADRLEEIFANFTLHIEELLEQTARRRPAPWEHALNELAERLDRAGLEWFLCGSAALAARGIDVAPRDVDFVASDHGAAVEALGDALVEPPLFDRERGWIASWFGRAFLDARVEWIADVYPDYDDWGAPNETGPTAAGNLEPVVWNGRTLLLTPLDLQRAVNEKRGLQDRVDAIRRFERDS